MGMLAKLRDIVLPRRGPRVEYPIVTFDDERVTSDFGDKRESVAWRDLVAVEVVTTPDGPFAEDVFFVLAGKESGCVIPHSKVAPILPRLQRLAGFDNAALIGAMSCTDGARFTLWRRVDA